MEPLKLDNAAAQIAAGDGEQLFQTLLEAHRVDDDEATIEATMTTLEAMMTARPDVAGYLMARLHPEAGRRYLHHVADAIDLHMDASTSEALADTLTALARESVRPRLQKRCVEWAATIRRRTASALPAGT